jgi:hypothetical protein
MLPQHHLKGNPFIKKQVVDEHDFGFQPFVPTRIVENLEIEIKNAIPFAEPSFHSLLGNRGTGKTSSLIFLKNEIENIAKESGKNILVIFINKDYDKMIGDKYFFIYYLLFQRLPSSPKNIELEVEAEVKKYYLIYFLFDIPEDVGDLKELREFAKFLDFINRNHYGSIFVSMNQSHYDKLQKVTNIIGEDAKITTHNLERFYDSELMLKIASIRLKRFRNNGKITNEYHPFTFESLQMIAKHSNFNPRNFIVGCGFSLVESEKQKVDIIDDEFITRVLAPSFARQIIENKTEDLGEREFFMMIYDYIKNKMNGEADDMKEVYNKMKEGEFFSISYPSFIDILRKLHEWNIIRVERNFNKPKGKRVVIVA